METIDKKSHIESVAFNLFLNVGYDATSVRMICKEAKIEPPTLYNFFGSKKGLFFSILSNKLEQFMEESKLYNALVFALPLEVQLFSIFSAGIAYTVEHLESARFFFRYTLFSPGELNEEIQKILRDSYETQYQIVRAVINECVQVKLIGIDSQRAFLYFWEFLTNCNYNVVFGNWHPSKDELLELWEVFFIHRLKGSDKQ